MAIVTNLYSRWILDSRGLPTVTTYFQIEQEIKSITAQASVPSGASTGTYEALELRDNEKAFFGKGVSMAVKNVNQTIAKELIGKEFVSADEIDTYMLKLDSSENKSILGANAILSVSMAAHRAFADFHNLELWHYLRRLYFSNLPVNRKFPRLMCNVINGGIHADNPLDIQEFMIVPNTSQLETDIRAASEIYHTLKKNLHKNKMITALGDEGGFAPNLENTEKVLEYLQTAIKDAGYNSKQCQLALDCAANEFYDSSNNIYKIEGKQMNQVQLTDFYKKLSEKFKIISIEDGFNEDDVQGWKKITTELGKEIHLIGDDFFVTNPRRFEKFGLANKAANGVLIKLNQIGSVMETAEMINLAKNNNYITIISHRSGETVDTFISDLAFASQSEFIKLGAPARGERVAKFNRLLEIYDGLEE